MFYAVHAPRAGDGLIIHFLSIYPEKFRAIFDVM
jgi:hypothetical protein